MQEQSELREKIRQTIRDEWRAALEAGMKKLETEYIAATSRLTADHDRAIDAATDKALAAIQMRGGVVLPKARRKQRSDAGKPRGPRITLAPETTDTPALDARDPGFEIPTIGEDGRADETSCATCDHFRSYHPGYGECGRAGCRCKRFMPKDPLGLEGQEQDGKVEVRA